MEKVTDIVSDAEIERVHGGNFGSMTKREVVDEGVLQHAFGYSTGYTMTCILLGHRLICHTAPGMGSRGLTRKGFRYLRAMKAGTPLQAILDLFKEPPAMTMEKAVEAAMAKLFEFGRVDKFSMHAALTAALPALISDAKAEAWEEAANRIRLHRNLLNAQFEVIDISREDAVYRICEDAIRALATKEQG
ncbi:hypothetical protein GCM10007276_12520 [Agaricicola taiwanensis]|uniref:Uncharacterized protein n=1 Tax=Agaricicola taiwanensis TaxID=591372 RepID=A0A8J2VLJ6_9RHOB|nr:hypothetical protein [Agaricicola taiwanensis]GGE36521.1 hypothetical protein GCM10007276_12520 [Agaricicola taiwanensis]